VNCRKFIVKAGFGNLVGKNLGFDLGKGNDSGLDFREILEARLMQFAPVYTVCINRNGQK
jgi:hypothetical protein